MKIEMDKSCKNQNEVFDGASTTTFSEFAQAMCNLNDFCPKRDRCQDRMHKYYDEAKKPAATTENHTCPYCHTYCMGDCRS